MSPCRNNFSFLSTMSCRIAWSLHGIAYPEIRQEKARSGEHPLYELKKKDDIVTDSGNDLWHLWNSAMEGPVRLLQAHNSERGLYAGWLP
jgi:hypothetical protein